MWRQWGVASSVTAMCGGIRISILHTEISSEIRTKLRDWAVSQARAGCYSQAALSSNDSKMLYKKSLEQGSSVQEKSCDLKVQN